ncbi:hypothetical protein TEA_002214 [Camellia sinensis var. sinensis]|uniref:Pentatricopeptide repeat-containing protein n=1 Tax=Camellia sinensis var. sinensis TaxID=542762 RepID=A0A4V3WME4_CAMSN|nr:hypothetical protein TEA_002214 [Camellia sinensis var. sinensis]
MVMYSTIVNGLYRTGNTCRAVSLLRIMEEASCKPNTLVYTTIIHSLCKDRMVDDVIKLFIEMNEKGIFPDVVTYNSLIHGLCNFGQWKEAIKILREMLDSGIAPNVRTFNVLVDAYYQGRDDERGRGGHMDEAIRVFNNMVDKGLYPNIVSHNILINGYCKKMKIDEAMHLFQEMPRRGNNQHLHTSEAVDMDRRSVYVVAFYLHRRRRRWRSISGHTSCGVRFTGFSSTTGHSTSGYSITSYSGRQHCLRYSLEFSTHTTTHQTAGYLTPLDSTVESTPTSSSGRASSQNLEVDYGRVYTVVIVNCTFPSSVCHGGSGRQLLLHASTNGGGDRNSNVAATIEALSDSPWKLKPISLAYRRNQVWF